MTTKTSNLMTSNHIHHGNTNIHMKHKSIIQNNDLSSKQRDFQSKDPFRLFSMLPSDKNFK